MSDGSQLYSTGYGALSAGPEVRHKKDKTSKQIQALVRNNQLLDAGVQSVLDAVKMNGEGATLQGQELAAAINDSEMFSGPDPGLNGAAEKAFGDLMTEMEMALW